MSPFDTLIQDYCQRDTQASVAPRASAHEPYQFRHDQHGVTVFCQQINTNIVLHSAITVLTAPAKDDPKALDHIQSLLKVNFARQKESPSALAYDERANTLILYHQLPLANVVVWQFKEAMDSFCQSVLFWKKVSRAS
ncbi:MAG: type III secretion system chaperone [Alphaproteobacteria bacterium GM202ARS2]|nr:type III secretion system chaperone [Alphaproteobacteria bacterium GM202ARS2]